MTTTTATLTLDDHQTNTVAALATRLGGSADEVLVTVSRHVHEGLVAHGDRAGEVGLGDDQLGRHAVDDEIPRRLRRHRIPARHLHI